MVLVNAAAAIIVGGKAEHFGEAVPLARESVTSGAAYKKLEGLVGSAEGTLRGWRPMRQGHENFVPTLAASARKTIAEGYYNLEDAKLPHRSMVEAIARHRRDSRHRRGQVPLPGRRFAQVALERGEDRGGLSTGRRGRNLGAHRAQTLRGETRVPYGGEARVTIPVLMKDIVVDPIQIEAAALAGADVILLMASIFAARLSEFAGPDGRPGPRGGAGGASGGPHRKGVHGLA